MPDRSAGRPFETILSVLADDDDLSFAGHDYLPWSSFLLNPRRLRGSDFLMRWSQGEWSEKRLIDAVNVTGHFVALPYGPSGTAPSGDIRAFELYFERLDKAGLGKSKRPDLLVFRKSDEPKVERIVESVGGNPELPFVPEDDLRPLLDLALIGVECENSLWKASKMPDFGATLTPQKRLGGRLGLKKTAVLPTIILKDEDRIPLKAWQRKNKVPIHIWHVFYDRAYAIPFARAEQLIEQGDIAPTRQVFQAPGGASTTKTIFKIYYQHGYALGMSAADPELSPNFVEDKNGHILPYVVFKGGKLRLSEDALKVLGSLRP